MPSWKADVVVIGAGVSGLTTGVLLAENGLRVLVRTNKPPLRTTSAAAGAMWDPTLAEHAAVGEWGIRTLRVLSGLVRERVGVRAVEGVEVFTTDHDFPGWDKAPSGARKCTPSEIPPGYAAGWSYTTPIVDMPRYLRYLQNRLIRGGGRLRIGGKLRVGTAFKIAPIVVNCAGTGAARFVGDDSVRPVRGQLVVVRNPGITKFFTAASFDSSMMTYMLPQGDDILVLGGSMDEGFPRSWPDKRRVAAGIIDRCAAVDRRVRHAQVLSQRVGLRPQRPQVRLEAELWAPGCLLVHNYGHGGSGVSLSWGCAEAVAALVLGSSETSAACHI
ncbi:FAD-dependent oxidoreductase [Actinoplanes sp. RD1]|uniref:FAD-dependent oxidoreductase n=1 Tax=Actinoplanes sp. RD1 TaxID=3064538 RepID=UPI0027410FBF|nr:FAD-dependent oxidoreductase [Actinoplanes sp. RD1]